MDAPAGTGLTRLLAGLGAARRREALTHRSWARRGRPSYERLEFLGDSALEVIVRAELMRRHPDADEGDLSWMRQSIVNRAVCARLAQEAGLDELCAGQAPEARRAAARELVGTVNVCGALTEAVIGASWLELGPAPTAREVIDAFAEPLARAVPGMRDAKTALQERAARERRTVSYRLVHQEGPPQARTFTSQVLIDGRPHGEGSGASKQASEQEAARHALTALREQHD